MKKVLLFGIFVLLIPDVQGQKITGTVFDKLTEKVIPGATVFLNGSLIWSRTDRFGDFELPLPENQKLPIVATCSGHETLLLLDYPMNAHVHFYIDPRIYAMDNSIIYKKEKGSFRQNLKIFREQFLGNSVNGKSCKIINERDLVLKYDPRTALLKVQSGKPLIIVNKTLGYRITYYLTKFEFSFRNDSVSCLGCCQFIEEHGLRGDKLSIAEKRRQMAYFGSELEFFRSLWHNTLDSAGYDLRNASNKTLTYDSLVIERSGIKYWKYKDPVTVYHFSKNKFTTFQTKDTVYFDKIGYYDTQGVNWRKSGEMTFQRLGDRLPYDYGMGHGAGSRGQSSSSVRRAQAEGTDRLMRSVSGKTNFEP